MHWRAMLFSPKGRIRRSEYWIWSLGATAAIVVIVVILDSIISNLTVTFLSYIVYVAALVAWLWINVALTAKRWHDRNRSAWLYLLIFTGIGTIWTLIECGMIDGTPGPNRYGESPKMMHSMPGIF